MYGFHKGQPGCFNSLYYEPLTAFQLATSFTMVPQNHHFGSFGTEKGRFDEAILRA